MPPVTLRPLARTDAVELIAGHLASQQFHAPYLAPFTDLAGFEARFARQLIGANLHLVARIAASEQIIGAVSITEIVLGVFKSAYLGYYVLQNFARQGLMTEAVRQATHYAFTSLGLHRLEAAIQPENTASLALIRRLGFQKEGYSPRYLFINGAWQDCERWALLAEEESSFL
jgi:ribosomal-protein-alanine N-acetyltransferase